MGLRFPSFSLARHVALALIVALVLAPVALAQEPAASAAAPDAQDKAWQAEQQARLTAGDKLLQAGQPEDAIREAFDPIIQAYESRYASSGKNYYCARTSTELLAYMLLAAATHDRGESDGKDAIGLDSTWAYGYYGKAYALIDLKRHAEATEALDKALRLSPHNPQFLSERGHLHQVSKQWQEMLDSNLSAEEFVDVATPEDQRDGERARALRGQGFALIELDRLDEAQARFEASLKFEPGSAMARGELDYIRTLRKQK